MSLFGDSKEMQRKIHKNEVFRVLKCHLSIEETAKLCDVSLIQVKKWDAGSPIPSVKRKLMELFKCQNLAHVGWEGWQIKCGELISPMNFRFQPQMLESMAILWTNDERVISHSGVMRLNAVKRKPKKTRR